MKSYASLSNYFTCLALQKVRLIVRNTTCIITLRAHARCKVISCLSLLSWWTQKSQNTIWDLGTWATCKHNKSSEFMKIDSKWVIHSTIVPFLGYHTHVHQQCLLNAYCVQAMCFCSWAQLVQNVRSWHAGQNNSYCIVASYSYLRAMINREQHLIE